MYADARHRRATLQSLSWAEDDAANGDYVSALQWLAVVDAVDGTLTPDYAAKRERWRELLDAARRDAAHDRRAAASDAPHDDGPASRSASSMPGLSAGEALRPRFADSPGPGDAG